MEAERESPLSESTLRIRERRELMYRSGARQRKFRIRTTSLKTIDNLKSLYRFRNRDAVANNLLSKARTLYNPEDLQLVPAISQGESTADVVLMLDQNYLDYIDEIRAHYPGTTVGRALESLLAKISDLEPAPQQLRMNLNFKEGAVSG
ncbi:MULTISPECIES: hypothetical protein [unclassified Novosphingobium]|uniref:hypothetical protein n=1 Tax=unclassified Novosphingobium TaxID=2644732 RepID=UPI00146A1E12|nr:MULTISPECIES: hypothetical protein [unclassified Novosphingobium]NMN07559.1 hypothetical protein [Novosphingobium sp. SG919]NMN89838.1 hypothetical protein [Novosphingobium sp. SG916]